MDGFTLSFMARELRERLLGGRVDRASQPERDVIVLVVRNQGTNYRLLLSANANNARAQITKQSFENPAEAPVLCMLVRKHLSGARISAIEQFGCDRVLTFTFQCVNEMGDAVTKSLVLEAMGRHSNLSLVDENQITIDCVHHVNADISRVRVSMPGKAFTMPPEQDKLNPFVMKETTLFGRLSALSSPLYKAMIDTVSGLSAMSAKELCVQIGVEGALPCGALDIASVAKQTVAFFQTLSQKAAPAALYDPSGQMIDTFPFPYQTLSLDLQKPYPSLSEAMDALYGERELFARMKQRGASIRKLVKNNVARLEKKKGKMMEALTQNDRMEQNRMYGELLTANLHQIEKGAATARVVNYYDPEQVKIVIPLQPELSPARNAQQYYKKYRKAKGAQQYAEKELGNIEKDLEILENVAEDLDKCTTTADLNEIKTFLIDNGFMRPDPHAGKRKKIKEGEPYRFTSADGTEITVGKNAVQNDRITLHARANETWLHAQNVPGSHVLIRTEDEPSDETLLYAAKLAAYFSKGRNHPSFPIDYTKRKYVKKKSGTPSGFVIYQNFKTLLIGLTPQDFETIRHSMMNVQGGTK